MEARIAKWGNSCGIRLPNSIIKALNMGEGTTVDIHVEKDYIVVSKTKSYKLNGAFALGEHFDVDTGAIHHKALRGLGGGSGPVAGAWSGSPPFGLS